MEKQDSEVLELAQALIKRPSITPDDAGCQTIIAEQLTALGFRLADLSTNAVKNLWARRGDAQPLFVFSGHTDVVPPGPISRWSNSPFAATVHDGKLFGRGAAGMKAALAAMIISCKKFLTQYPHHQGSIGFIITSDEQGDAIDGARKIVQYLEQQNEKIKWCVIGEASSNKRLGDAIQIGRRGSLHGFLQVKGKQGHVAYPQLADNPIHRSFKALDALTQMQWDHGDPHFSPTTLQIYNIQADTGASNIIPGALSASFNFRFSPASTPETLQQRAEQILREHSLDYSLDWQLASRPFLSEKGELTQACVSIIEKNCQITPEINTTGGTSDGRFIAPTGCEVVELGPVGNCMNQVNEYVHINDIFQLTELYYQILSRMLGK